MSDFQVRADAIDVEAIMRQIRARVREKRGVDYTDAEVQELAKVKLEQFLDPRGVRSDLVAQFRKHRTVSPAPANYAFEDSTIYETHRGIIRTLRRLLNPLLKLFFNPQPIADALHLQAKINNDFHQRFRQREDMDPLYYELVHNLVLEVTRLGIEVHNLKMRAESLSSRMDFDERRARALETVVQYRPPRQQQQQSNRQPAQSPAAPAPAESQAPDAAGAVADATAGDPERRRRRRRRRRRPGQTLGDGGGNGTDAGDDGGDDGPDASEGSNDGGQESNGQ
ncbi:MAG: hypothetical protein AB7L71_13575 [Vicinamibacterales bacterium]